MGCYFPRIGITAEEAAVINFETNLRYSDLSVIYLDKVHRKYSYKGNISESQWKDICNILKLSLSYLDCSQHILNYYENYKGSTYNFSLKKLLILGVLLGDGKPLEKGRLLFEAMDDSGCEILNSGQVQDLVEIMVKIACEMNPRILMKDEFNDVTFEDLEKYMAKLSRGIKDAIHKAVEEIMKGCDMIRIKEFLSRLSLGEMQSFLSANGVRTYVKMHTPRYKARKFKAD